MTSITMNMIKKVQNKKKKSEKERDRESADKIITQIDRAVMGEGGAVKLSRNLTVTVKISSREEVKSMVKRAYEDAGFKVSFDTKEVKSSNNRKQYTAKSTFITVDFSPE